MKTLLALILLTTSAMAADTIIESPFHNTPPMLRLVSGKLIPITAVMSTDGAGGLIPSGVSSPVGAATLAAQTTGNASLASIEGKLQASFATRADTYIATGNGTTVNASSAPTKDYSIQVKGTGAAATAWDARLECSLNNADFTMIAQHTNVDGDGVVKFSALPLACLYFRSRVSGLTLGTATNIVVTILGKQ